MMRRIVFFILFGVLGLLSAEAQSVQDTVLLQEVAISRKAPNVFRSKGKIVVNVQNNPHLMGKNTFDILFLAPSVSVLNKKITIEGNPPAQIQVNGVPLLLKGKALENYLSNLKAENIHSIEVMPLRSAENDAQGMGGVLNIILRKQLIRGVTGSVSYEQTQGLGKFPGFNPAASLIASTGKLQMSAEGGYSHNRGFIRTTQDRTLEDGSKLHTSHGGDYSTPYIYWNSNLYYSISQTQTINAYYSGASAKEIYPSSSTTSISRNDSLQSLAVADLPSYSTIQSHSGGLYYGLMLDSLKSKLTFTADYVYDNRMNRSDFDNRIYNGQNQLSYDTLFRSLVPRKTQLYTMELKYKKVFTSGSELTLGGKSSISNIHAQNLDQQFNSGWLVPHTEFDYRYKEYVNAAYVNLSHQLFSSVDCRVGLRMEHSAVKGSLSESTQDTVYSQNYTDFFPSIFLGKNMDANANHYLALAYNRSIARPSFRDLNPYRFYESAYNIQCGNPYLHPSFTDSYSLRYTFKKRYQANLSYLNSKDMVNMVDVFDAASNVSKSMPQNIGDFKNYSLDLYVPISIRSWWTSNNSLSIVHTQSLSSHFNLAQTNVVFESNHEFTLNKWTSIDFGCFYKSGAVYGNAIYNAKSSISMGAARRFCNNKWVINANISDLFYQDNHNNSTYYDQVETRNTLKMQTRYLKVSITYNFNAGRKVSKKDTEKSNGDEMRRI